jgi:hypothetical protein
VCLVGDEVGVEFGVWGWAGWVGQSVVATVPDYIQASGSPSSMMQPSSACNTSITIHTYFSSALSCSALPTYVEE